MAVLTPNTEFRDYIVDGVSSSGNYKPKKANIRALLNQLAAGASLGALIYSTKAQLDANTGASDNQMGWVVADPTGANNGIYQSLSGSWTKLRSLPDTVAVLTNVAGTANAITADVEAGVDPEEVKLFFLPNPPGTNTGGAMTLTINAGESIFNIKSASGANLASGDVIENIGTMFFKVSDTEVRQLVSSQTGATMDFQGTWSAVVTYTEGQFVSDTNKLYYLTSASSLNEKPGTGSPDPWLLVVDFTSIYTSGDISVADYGAVGDGVTDDYTAITNAIAAAVAAGKKLIFPDGEYYIETGIVFADDYLHVEFHGNARLKPEASLLVPLTIGSNASSPTRMRIIRPKVDRTTLDTGTENIGIVFLAFNQSTIVDAESRWCKYNLVWSPSAGGSAYNTYINAQGIGGYFNWHVLPSSTGYVNENTFIGGRTFAGAGTIRNVVLDAGGTNVPNNNRFYGCSFEGNIAIKVECIQADFNLFSSCRFEGSGRDIVFQKDTDYNRVEVAEYNAFVEDYSANQRNTYQTRYGDHRENGNNNVIGESRKYDGTISDSPASTGVTITGITKASPGVVTATSHGFSDGDYVVLHRISGMTELNGKVYRVSNSTTNTFELQDVLSNNVDTTNFTTYTSGGYAMRGPAIKMMVHTQTGAGYSNMLDLYHGRDGSTSFSARGIRYTDGLVRWSLSTGGHLMVAQQLYNQQSGWTFSPLRLGNYHLWVDGTGRLRMKSGAPSSDTDGTVVGTQT